MGTTITYDFRGAQGQPPEEEKQLALFNRYDPSLRERASSRNFVHPTLGKALSAAKPRIHRTAYLLAESLASFMRLDNDRAAFFCWPSRELILERAGLTSLTTFKRHFPEAMTVLGISVRRRKRGSNVYTWDVTHVQKLSNQEGPYSGPSRSVTGSRRDPLMGHEMAHRGGPLYGPLTRKHKEQEEVAHQEPAQTPGALASVAWACPETQRILQTAGFQTQAQTHERLECESVIRSQFPRWLAYLESYPLSRHARAQSVAFDLAHYANHPPAVERTREIDALLATVDDRAINTGLAASQDDETTTQGAG